MIVESARIVIEIDGERALATLLAGPDIVSIKRSRQDAQPAKHPIILDIPIALKRAGTGMKLVVPGRVVAQIRSGHGPIPVLFECYRIRTDSGMPRLDIRFSTSHLMMASTR